MTLTGSGADACCFTCPHDAANKGKNNKNNFLIAYILNYYFTNKADAGMGANFSAEGSFQAQLKYSPS